MIHPSEPNPFLPVGATSLAETDGPSERPRTVLVLGGGGMRGMAHIGVLKAIEEAGIQVDAVVGTSIGALIGAMYAGGLSVAEIEPFARQLKKDDYFKLSTLRILLKGHRTPSLYQGQRFHDSLEKVLPVRSFADMKIPFYCNAVSPPSSSRSSTAATTTSTAASRTRSRCASRRRCRPNCCWPST